MLAIFQDVQIELEELGEEVRRLDTKRKLYREALNKDIEIADSHMRAMASFIHDIYTGIEKLLESLVRYFDQQLPLGDDWHRKLLSRANFPNDPVRPAIISDPVHSILDELRSFRHVFRNRYLSNLIPQRVDDLAGQTLKVFEMLRDDMQRFIEAYESGAYGKAE